MGSLTKSSSNLWPLKSKETNLGLLDSKLLLQVMEVKYAIIFGIPHRNIAHLTHLISLVLGKVFLLPHFQVSAFGNHTIKTGVAV